MYFCFALNSLVRSGYLKDFLGQLFQELGSVLVVGAGFDGSEVFVDVLRELTETLEEEREVVCVNNDLERHVFEGGRLLAEVFFELVDSVGFFVDLFGEVGEESEGVVVEVVEPVALQLDHALGLLEVQYERRHEDAFDELVERADGVDGVDGRDLVDDDDLGERRVPLAAFR